MRVVATGTIVVSLVGTGLAGFVARQTDSVQFDESIVNITELNAFAVFHHSANSANNTILVGNSRAGGTSGVAWETLSVDPNFAILFVTINGDRALSVVQLFRSLA